MTAGNRLPSEAQTLGFHMPPKVRPSEHVYYSGARVTTYHAPHESEGPIVRDESGQRVMYYMFAYYVFRWPEGSTQVSVGHGSIARNTALLDGLTIVANAWKPYALASFAQRWAVEQLQKFAMPARSAKAN